MDTNKLQQHFKDATIELTLIIGRIGVLNSLLTNSNERINDDQNLNNDLMLSSLALYDITNITKPNEYITCEVYKLNKLNLNDEVHMILNREHLFYISQAYEVLETYLYNQVSEFIVLKQSLHLFIDSKSNKSDFKSTRKALKSFSDRKNNRHLISILRANCSLFNLHEKTNIYNIDFHQWIEMLSEVRHCVVHNRTELTSEIKNALPSYYSKYFKTSTYGDSEIIEINFGNCLQLLGSMFNYIFFIYKAVNQTCYHETVEIDSLKSILPNMRLIRIINNKIEVIK